LRKFLSKIQFFEGGHPLLVYTERPGLVVTHIQCIGYDQVKRYTQFFLVLVALTPEVRCDPDNFFGCFLRQERADIYIRKGELTVNSISMASSSSSTLSRGPILTGNNYDVWSIKMKKFIRLKIVGKQ
jgi:hypothetical protein